MVSFYNIFWNYKKITYVKWVFWVNIAKLEVNWHYRYYSKLFGILRREIEFRYYRCQNSTKSMREKKKKVERENVEFWQRWYRIFSAQFCCSCVECLKWKGKKKKNWQMNCGNAIAEICVSIFFLAIVAMALPKIGEKKSYEIYERVKKKKLSCPQYFYKIFTINHTWLVIISSKKFVTN